MEIRYLRSFLRTVELGSVSRAAASLNIVQPALSRQIRLLEAEIGTLLLVRHRRGVTLTEAGKVLRDRAEAIVAAIDDARMAASSAGAEPSGPVGLGLPASMLYVLSAALVETYCHRYPRAYLRVHEAFGHVIESLLRCARIDVAILISPQPMQDVALEPLVSEAICLAGPLDSGLAMGRPVSLENLARVPMIMFGKGNKVRMVVERHLEETRLAFNSALEVEGQPLVLDLIRRGVGYTILPACAVQAEIALGRIAAAPIHGLAIDWTLGVNRSRAEASAVAALTDLLREIVAAQVAEGRWQVVSRSGYLSGPSPT